MISQVIKKLVIILVVAYAAIYPFVQHSPVESSLESELDIEIGSVKKHISKKSHKNVHLPDFASIRDVKEKKHAFFTFMKPFVLEVNEELGRHRAFVESFSPQSKNASDKKRFLALAKKYRIKELDDLHKVKAELLTRVDIIPVDLVLMQAANESGWGTSRFALEANNLFGQWCFTKGCGVIPTGRPAGKTYEVRKFATPADSIRSYFHNLNTGHAYAKLRQLRNQQRVNHDELDPYVIAEGLLPYSTRREAYVEEIQEMLRFNQKYM
ncbi:glucosaminidase domain-containing protein [Psychrosphaera sp. B3R10]|uniref:glucosaminidase domain-containing protein n=1 Tax=unclassified Psychrosphaera TaxID=2641570 RepID=UPI001C0931B9|nr:MULTISPECIES: glucosaminidase domain-containing protein [unclassified Psychrosphaera]MBU2882365.1 glucosaminidase domain-containing protein [Psychrosphaera sp. I2R16]MBU2989046.1 glucosaminidase domain-containing protein [Psychrosphaera sp. B3R10]